MSQKTTVFLDCLHPAPNYLFLVENLYQKLVTFICVLKPPTICLFGTAT